MTAQFPTGIPVYANPTASMTLGSAQHDVLHSNNNDDTIELARKVGSGAFTPAVVGDLLYATGVLSSAWGAVSMRKLAEQVLGGATATVTFSSIPQNYRHMILWSYARGDTAAASTPIWARLNAEGATTNYDYQRAIGSAASWSTSESLAGANWYTGSAPAANASIVAFSISIAFLAYYGNNGSVKNAVVLGAFKTANTTGGITLEVTANYWRGTAPITTLQLFPGAGNFAAGSVFGLYGVPAV